MNMHLAEHVEVFPECRLWLAYFDGNSDESFAATAHQIEEAKFSTHDLHRWQQFRTAEKKRQFLNSRLAIRAVLRREFGNNVENIQFDSDSYGRPILQSHQTSHVAQIGLSHSENVIAVAISDGKYPADVDIKISNPLRTKALRSVALHPHEQVWCDLQSGSESEALTILWTIKESVWKTIPQEHNIPFSDISVPFEGGRLKPIISNRHSEPLQFQTKVFAQQRRPVVSDALCFSTADVSLLGSVTQRLVK